MGSFAVPYEEMHPKLQRYYDIFKSNLYCRIIRHAQKGQTDFVRHLCCDTGAMFSLCRENNLDPIMLFNDIIEYCNVTIGENDIEYYTRK